MKTSSIQRRVFEIIERSEDGDTASRVFDLFIVSLILLNVAAVIAASFATFRAAYAHALDIFEIVSVAIFTVEYVLRLWTARYKYPHLRPALATVRYVFSFLALIDLCAVLPFYLPALFRVDLRFLRILRVTRILRVLKIHRYAESLQMIGRVLRDRGRELLVTIFITTLLLLVASSAMYYLEGDAQPEQFPNIVASFWWAIATLTTVGYGDVFPVTTGGKIISGIIALLGIGLVALPTGIISSGFLDELQRKRENTKPNSQVCPHCGEPQHPKEG